MIVICLYSNVCLRLWSLEVMIASTCMTHAYSSYATSMYSVHDVLLCLQYSVHVHCFSYFIFNVLGEDLCLGIQFVFAFSNRREVK